MKQDVLKSTYICVYTSFYQLNLVRQILFKNHSKSFFVFVFAATFGQKSNLLMSLDCELGRVLGKWTSRKNPALSL